LLRPCWRCRESATQRGNCDDTSSVMLGHCLSLLSDPLSLNTLDAEPNAGCNGLVPCRWWRSNAHALCISTVPMRRCLNDHANSQCRVQCHEAAKNFERPEQYFHTCFHSCCVWIDRELMSFGRQPCVEWCPRCRIQTCASPQIRQQHERAPAVADALQRSGKATLP